VLVKIKFKEGDAFMFKLLGILTVLSGLAISCASAAYTKITHTYELDGKKYTVESMYPAGPLGLTQPGEALNGFIQSIYPPPPTATPVPAPQTTTSGETATPTPSTHTPPVKHILNRWGQ